MIWPRRPHKTDRSPEAPSATSPAAEAGVSRLAWPGLGVALLLLAIELGLLGLASSAPEASGTSPAVPDFPRPADLTGTRANPSARVPVSPFRFAETAREAGIDFVHVSGMTE